MKILPKIGVDNIRLGLNRNQVTEILGQPHFIETESNNERWQYEQGLELLFQKEDLYLLGLITVTNTAARLDSKCIIGINEEELLNNFPFLSLDNDFEENGKDYTSAEEELSVWVAGGVVSNVTLFPAYDKTGEIPVWPDADT